MNIDIDIDIDIDTDIQIRTQGQRERMFSDTFVLNSMVSGTPFNFHTHLWPDSIVSTHNLDTHILASDTCVSRLCSVFTLQFLYTM